LTWEAVSGRHLSCAHPLPNNSRKRFLGLGTRIFQFKNLNNMFYILISLLLGLASSTQPVNDPIQDDPGVVTTSDTGGETGHIPPPPPKGKG
jgi:hypothetical protein